MSGATATVDLGAIARNTRAVRAVTPAAVMAVVKADAFGHGAVDVASTALAAGASWLGVTSIEEALALRDAGIDAPILSWLNRIDAPWADAVAQRIDVAVASLEQLEAVAAAAARAHRTARVHLHVDTGMAREGAPMATWDSLCSAAARLEHAGAVAVVGLMGHLPCADDPAHQANARSVEQFALAGVIARAYVRNAPMRHLAASAAVLGGAADDSPHRESATRVPHGDIVRIGAALVGIDSQGTGHVEAAMSVGAPVISVRHVDAGTPVGYGHSHVMSSDTHLALIAMGYADGIPAAAAGKAHVFLAGRPAPIVGRVSMDSIVVDAGTTPPRVGDWATIFGPGRLGEPTAADWARWSGTLAHDIVTGLGARVARVTLPADDVSLGGARREHAAARS